MFRELAIAAAMACAAVGAAPVAMGEPNDNMYFDKPGRYSSDVPGMNYDAHLAGGILAWKAAGLPTDS